MTRGRGFTSARLEGMALPHPRLVGRMEVPPMSRSEWEALVRAWRDANCITVEEAEALLRETPRKPDDA